MSFSPTVKEIPAQTEVLPAEGEATNGAHTAPKRLISGVLLVILRIVHHGWNALEEMHFDVNWFGFPPE